MSKIITSPSGIVTPAHDPYWDSPITRREVQQAVNDIAYNEKNLNDMLDTSNIVLNFLAEKVGVTRAEIEVWVEKKKVQIAEVRAAQAKATAEVPTIVEAP